MKSREDVIKGLEQFISDFKPFCGNKSDWQRVYDALALLKAQAAVEPIQDMVGDALFWVCGKCGHEITSSDWYCAHCGRAVKWE